MKLLFRQFAGKNRHSWSIVGYGLMRALKFQGHEIDLFSTDGILGLPNDLKENLIGYVEENKNNKIFGKSPNNSYDSCISYTSMKNFPEYLKHSKYNRFGIWCFEWNGTNILPNGFAKNYKYCDYILAPSNFAKEVFINSGVPEKSIQVISHGIDSNYTNASILDLKTNKKFKILANIAQNHLRKNIPGLLDAYGKAFTNKDNVILFLKAKYKKKENIFDIDLNECMQDFYKKYKYHADIRIISEYIEDMSELYRSIDCVFTMSHTEGFYFPAVEALASGKINIAPNYGGQLDFLNEDNSLLISGKIVRANPKSMYWESKPNAVWFDPDINDAIDKLKYAYNNFEMLNSKINRENVYKQYNWEVITKEILKLCII